MTDTAVVTEAAPEAAPVAPETGGEAPPEPAPEATPEQAATPEATPEATPAPESVEATPTPPDTPFERPPEPLSKDQVKQQMRDGTPVVDRYGRKHDSKTGEYLPTEGETPEVPPEGVATATPEEPKAPEEAPEAPAADKQAADQPSDAEAVTERLTGRVEIKPEHPVAGMGQAVIETATPAQAEVVKALLKGTYFRRQMVAELEKEITKRDEKIARMESQTAALSKWEGTPEYTAAVERFHDIKTQVGDEAASQYWVGVQRDLEVMEQTEYADRMRVNSELADQRAGDSWRSQAYENTSGLPPAIRDLPQFKVYFKAALESFDAELKLGHHPDVVDQATMHTKFSELFKQRLTRQPDVKAVLSEAIAVKNKAAAAKVVGDEKVKRDKDAAVAAGVQDFKVGVAESRKTNPTNPLAGMGPGAAGSAIPPETAGEAEAPPQTAFDLKRQQKDAARADARRHLQI